ncbi:DUF2026 family protein [Sphingobium sp. RAC03]|uniref:DUF2026 family protein n=1 Tax=Sphingobium sp. RAC03 TaxID=1843368 RepID=UPI00149621A5|nr:DUF2026 family protein [Sphingobium sp. RAC03]
MSKFLIPLPDFNRIHQVAHGVIKDFGTVEKACTFFSIFGAYVLSQKYGIEARPIAGGFSLCVAEDRCLIYGREEHGEYVVDSDGFHMWVQTPTHIIDFTAPIYPEAFAQASPDITLPRKMLQKQITEERSNLNDVVTIGDFVTYPDPALTNELIGRFMKRPANSDLIQIADHWFGNRRAKQAVTSQMFNDLGEVTTLNLPKISANGAW